MISKQPRKGIMDYDFAHDVFYSRSSRRNYSHSEQVGDFLIDFDTHNKIIGLELFNASKYFNKPKDFLKEVFFHSVNVEISDEFIMLRIEVLSHYRNQELSSSLNVERVNVLALEPSSLRIEA